MSRTGLSALYQFRKWFVVGCAEYISKYTDSPVKRLILVGGYSRKTLEWLPPVFVCVRTLTRIQCCCSGAAQRTLTISLTWSNRFEPTALDPIVEWMFNRAMYAVAHPIHTNAEKYHVNAKCIFSICHNQFIHRNWLPAVWTTACTVPEHNSRGWTLFNPLLQTRWSNTFQLLIVRFFFHFFPHFSLFFFFLLCSFIHITCDVNIYY